METKMTGFKSKPTGKPLQKIHRLLVGKDTRQLKHEFISWARKIVHELTKLELRIKAIKTSVGRLTQQLVPDSQSPVCKDSQDDELLVVEWGMRKIVRLNKPDKNT